MWGVVRRWSGYWDTVRSEHLGRPRGRTQVELVSEDTGAATRYEVRIVPTRRVTSVSAMEATVQSVPRHSSVPADASGSGRTCNDFGPRRGVTVPNLASSALCHGKIQLSLTCKMAAAETDGSAVEWSTSKQGGVVPLRNLECHSERGRLHCPMAKRSPGHDPRALPQANRRLPSSGASFADVALPMSAGGILMAASTCSRVCRRTLPRSGSTQRGQRAAW
jgi:hypothetical protein